MFDCGLGRWPLFGLSVGYATAVVAATAVWVWAFRRRSFGFLALAMFFPAAFVPPALLLAASRGDCSFGELLAAFCRRRLLAVDGSVALFSVLGMVAQLLSIGLTVLLGVCLGWTRRHTSSSSSSSALHPHNRDWLSGLLRAAGEEIGWRSFLLPLLYEALDSRPLATAVVGLTWGLYHVPVMLLLSSKLKPERPMATVAVQFASCFFSSFVFSWAAERSGFSFVPPTLMHWLWNRVNPALLGSIYTHEQGMFVGQQWLINGEGLAGTVVSCLLAVLLSLL